MASPAAKLKAKKLQDNLKIEFNKKDLSDPSGLAEYVFGKVQPQVIPLEEAVLGALMADRYVFGKIKKIITADDFYLESHQLIFKACADLNAAGSPIDMLLVTEQIKQNGHLEKIGNAYYLAELTNRVASSANIEYHARIIKQKSLLREVIKVSSNLIKRAYEDNTDPFALMAEAEKKFHTVPEISYLTGRPVNEDMQQAESEPDLKQICGEFLLDNGLTVLVASTGVGKTVASVQIAEAIARGETFFKDSGILANQCGPKKVVYIDFELSRNQFKNRYSDKNLPKGDPFRLYEFSENFIRVSRSDRFYEVKMGRRTFDEVILEEVENAILEHSPDVIIVDNVSSMTQFDIGDPQVTFDIISQLNVIKAKYKIGILAIAHTVKMIPRGTAIETYHAAGGASLSRFVDNLAALGVIKTRDAEGKETVEFYLKSLKVRDGEMQFGENNVIRMSRINENGKFLRYTYLGTAAEEDLINATGFTRADSFDELMSICLKLRDEDGLSYDKIIAQLPPKYKMSKPNLITKLDAFRNRTKVGGIQYEFQSTIEAQENAVMSKVRQDEVPF